MSYNDLWGQFLRWGLGPKSMNASKLEKKACDRCTIRAPKQLSDCPKNQGEEVIEVNPQKKEKKLGLSS